MHKQQFFDISVNFASTSLPDILQFIDFGGLKTRLKNVYTNESLDCTNDSLSFHEVK